MNEQMLGPKKLDSRADLCVVLGVVPQKELGNNQSPAAKLCRMCPSSTFRQQTYYQLLGLTFLVRVKLLGSLQFKLCW